MGMILSIIGIILAIIFGIIVLAIVILVIKGILAIIGFAFTTVIKSIFYILCWIFAIYVLFMLI